MGMSSVASISLQCVCWCQSTFGGLIHPHGAHGVLADVANAGTSPIDDTRGPQSPGVDVFRAKVSDLLEAFPQYVVYTHTCNYIIIIYMYIYTHMNIYIYICTYFIYDIRM